MRNFSIIAHIDHGKSTLADRLLELTGAVEPRRMHEQFLDIMELERERGITIKLQPVRLVYQGEILNLIDTPGHIDFAYEVSRALAAVEGAVLLVDATKGVQAQTLSVLAAAQAQGLTIIPVINKIDLPAARVDETTAELMSLLGCRASEILTLSAKTGENVPALLAALGERLPAPAERTGGLQALIFDFEYSPHRGIIIYLRVFSGAIAAGADLSLLAAGRRCRAIEVGIFAPEKIARPVLVAGEIGYVVTGIKDLTGGAAHRPRVGDTVTLTSAPAPALPGYAEPAPVVFASLYPESGDDFPALRRALATLSLSDAALVYEEESSGALGRGFRAGFLGPLHLEIVTERLRREHALRLVVTPPSTSYELDGKLIYSPLDYPEEPKGHQVRETWIEARIITPPEYLGAIIKLLADHEGSVLATEDFGPRRNLLKVAMPLRELVRAFFDELKSVTAGFASLAYEPRDWRPADIVRLDLLVAEELVPAFSRLLPRRRLPSEAEKAVEQLAALLPRELFVVKIQARGLGRVIASRSLRALKKDVTGYLYGGDITRKRKLWEKQKRGKEKLAARGRVNIPQEVFVKMLSSGK